MYIFYIYIYIIPFCLFAIFNILITLKGTVYCTCSRADLVACLLEIAE